MIVVIIVIPCNYFIIIIITIVYRIYDCMPLCHSVGNTESGGTTTYIQLSVHTLHARVYEKCTHNVCRYFYIHYIYTIIIIIICHIATYFGSAISEYPYSILLSLYSCISIRYIIYFIYGDDILYLYI